MRTLAPATLALLVCATLVAPSALAILPLPPVPWPGTPWPIAWPNNPPIGPTSPTTCKPLTLPVGLNVNLPRDVGDAPDSTNGAMTSLYGPGALSATGRFPTVGTTAQANHPGQPGARHTHTAAAWLGDRALYANPGYFGPRLLGDVPPSLELDANSVPDADGITNLQGNTPDHDGHDGGLAPASLPAGGTGVVRFRLSGNEDIHTWYINVLADWDYDGVWRNDPTGKAFVPEWIVRNHIVDLLPGWTWEFTSPPFPVGFSPGNPWVRITLSPQKVDPTLYPFDGWDGEVPPGIVDQFGIKAFACGETEDSCGLVTVVGNGQFVTCP